MRVLMVGNSYTYYNEMPALLAALARENGFEMTVDAVTKGGRRMYENLAPEDLYHREICRLCETGRYDVLILQEQSYFAIENYEAFLEGMRGVAALVNPRRTVLYATWGRKEGSALLEELGMTSPEMTEALAAAYERAAETMQAQVAHVGRAFVRFGTLDPTVELYNKDLSHPSPSGSALAAMTLYCTLFGEAPRSYASLSEACGVTEAYVGALQES